MATREQREAAIANAARIVRSGIYPFGRKVGQSSRLPRLHHATVQVNPNDVPMCLEFYREILGLKSVSSPILSSVWYEQGVHLYWGGGHYEREEAPPEHFALEVGSKYSSIRQRCMALGLFLQDGTAYWGSPRCYVMDPAHNRIELMERAP